MKYNELKLGYKRLLFVLSITTTILTYIISYNTRGVDETEAILPAIISFAAFWLIVKVTLWIYTGFKSE